MLTKAEMVDALKYALAVSESEGGTFLELGCRTAKALLAALEEKPLAEKKGWIHPDDFCSILDSDLFWDEGPLPPGRKDEGFTPVTVTITARDGGSHEE